MKIVIRDSKVLLDCVVSCYFSDQNELRLYVCFLSIENFKGVSATAISPTELLELLQSKDVSNTVDTCGRVFSEEELNKLLDRSDMVNIDAKNTGDTHKATEQPDSCSDGNQHYKVINVSASTDENIVF